MKRNILKIGHWKLELGHLNKGMTYVELIVVLSIFSIMTSITTFNYGAFQGKVDIKNLVNDIAIKVVEAQKSAMFGQLNSHTYPVNWRPSYGLYFTLTADGLADNKSFNYFANLNNSPGYDDGTCNPTNLAGECLEKINITKGNLVSAIKAYNQDGSSQNIGDITMIFTRPDSGPLFVSRSSLSSTLSYVQITVSSPKGPSAVVNIYKSGRIEIR